MKSKLLKSIGIAVLCLAIVLGNVLAFSLGVTDGVWGLIDREMGDGYPDDASCDGWGRATNSPYIIWDVLGVIYNVNVGPGGEDERWVRNSGQCSGDVDGDVAFNGDVDFGGWDYTSGAPAWGGFGSYSGCTTGTGLIITEYAYNQIGGDDEIAIEIYNGSPASINLSSYKLLLFYNDRDLTQVTLNNVNLASGGTYVIANNAAASEVTEQQTFGNNDSHRTVVLIQDYNPQVIGEMTSNSANYQTVQGVSPTDENQVRYGRPESGYTSCPSGTTGFNLQSGFGFEGIEVPQSEISEGDYFPVGRFCHYNNPITIANDGNNYFNQVPLTLNISNIDCDEDWVRQGSGNLEFKYLVDLVETPNTPEDDTCEYGPGDPQWPGGSVAPNVSGDIGPNRNGCADGVNFESSSSTQSFMCVHEDSTPENPIEQEYTVSILGFTQTQAGGVCPSVPVGTVQFNQIYTAETAKNCYCVYAAFTKGQITPVTLVNLSAIGVENGILISWETVTEANNLGFNIMRAESVDGEQVQINPELIMSEVAPGDMFGAAYEYLDDTAVEGVTYIYWLIDVPLDGSLPGVHGPISATR